MAEHSTMSAIVVPGAPQGMHIYLARHRAPAALQLPTGTSLAKAVAYLMLFLPALLRIPFLLYASHLPIPYFAPATALSWLTASVLIVTPAIRLQCSFRMPWAASRRL